MTMKCLWVADLNANVTKDLNLGKLHTSNVVQEKFYQIFNEQISVKVFLVAFGHLNAHRVIVELLFVNKESNCIQMKPSLLQKELVFGFLAKQSNFFNFQLKIYVKTLWIFIRKIHSSNAGLFNIVIVSAFPNSK